LFALPNHSKIDFMREKLFLKKFFGYNEFRGLRLPIDIPVNESSVQESNGTDVSGCLNDFVFLSNETFLISMFLSYIIYFCLICSPIRLQRLNFSFP